MRILRADYLKRLLDDAGAIDILERLKPLTAGGQIILRSR